MDSNVKIDQETMQILIVEQGKQHKETGKKPSFKKLIADAVKEQFKK